MEDPVEPGAVKHGNFINYYDFNPAAERLKLLPADAATWTSADDAADCESEAYLVLDIGCNSGDLTQSLYGHLSALLPHRPIFILGIDIDAILIQRANESNGQPERIAFECVDIMAYDSCNHSPAVANYLRAHRKTRFDVACCFSITMWIHLNNGDDGLLRFLDVITQSSRRAVIEPQPWKCYRTAVRRLKRAGAAEVFPLFRSLAMRNNVDIDIRDYLTRRRRCQLVYESDQTKWKRTIYVFRVTENGDGQ